MTDWARWRSSLRSDDAAQSERTDGQPSEASDDPAPAPDAPPPPASAANPIPAGLRTRPLSLSEAGSYLGIPGTDQVKGRVARARIEAGTLRAHPHARRSYIFHVEDFPSGIRSRIKGG